MKVDAATLRIEPPHPDRLDDLRIAADGIERALAYGWERDGREAVSIDEGARISVMLPHSTWLGVRAETVDDDMIRLTLAVARRALAGELLPTAHDEAQDADAIAQAASLVLAQRIDATTTPGKALVIVELAHPFGPPRAAVHTPGSGSIRTRPIGDAEEMASWTAHAVPCVGITINRNPKVIDDDAAILSIGLSIPQRRRRLADLLADPMTTLRASRLLSQRDDPR